MSRFVMDSNNLWLLALVDHTIRVNTGPFSPDLNTQNLPDDVAAWKQVARIGSNKYCSHRELEVFGSQLNPQKVEQLWQNLYGRQLSINREGFTFTWHNRGTDNGRFKPGGILYRLNDLYEWSNHGVTVPVPVGTGWDRFERTTGKLMVGAGGGSAEVKKELEEKEKENKRLQEEAAEREKRAKEREDAAQKEIQELKEQAQAREDAAKKESEEMKKQAKEKDDQLAAKDKQIANLRAALAAFT
ncbi:unnamed protein product [Linum tenue]|uniref:Uncharacterized protein n=1 Tax=Linum tenue TaxID=586396 RepID=A0AAV0QM49_9ROSI|nr:unnamed protein product [Linum tenue]